MISPTSQWRSRLSVRSFGRSFEGCLAASIFPQLSNALPCRRDTERGHGSKHLEFCADERRPALHETIADKSPRAGGDQAMLPQLRSLKLVVAADCTSES